MRARPAQRPLSSRCSGGTARPQLDKGRCLRVACSPNAIGRMPEARP